MRTQNKKSAQPTARKSATRHMEYESWTINIQNAKKRNKKDIYTESRSRTINGLRYKNRTMKYSKYEIQKLKKIS